MRVAATRSGAGILAIITIAALSVALMAPGVGRTEPLAQAPTPTPGSSVAGSQTAAMLSTPIQAFLASGMTLNGLPFSAGQAISIVGLPAGFSLPQQGGNVMLPPGTVIIIPGRPDLGQITLTSGGMVNLGLGLPFVTVAQLPAPIGGILTTGMSVGGVQLPAGAQIFITGLPQGFVLPPSGIITLPPGATISVLGRPDLGQLTLTASSSVDLSASASMPMAPSVPLGGTVEATLTSGASIGGGLLLPAGAEVFITGLPQGLVLPQGGIITLPPGVTLMVPSRPDLGQVTLSAPASFDLSGGSAMLPGAAQARGRLLAIFSASGAQFAAGDVVDILSLPLGFNLPAQGAVTLPAGTVVGFPSRPELGAIQLPGPVRVELAFGGGLIGTAPTLPGGIAPAAMSATLVADLMFGSLQLSSGARIEILATPPGFSLPQMADVITLPPGTVVRFPDRPDLGPVTLPVPARVDMGLGVNIGPPAAPALPQPIPAAPIAAPELPTVFAPEIATLSSPRMASLAASFMWGGIELWPGEMIEIVALPADVTLEAGWMELPVGTVIFITGWPELGELSIDAPLWVEVAEVWMPVWPDEPSPGDEMM